jgi:purine-nucleoside phosphorylase
MTDKIDILSTSGSLEKSLAVEDLIIAERQSTSSIPHRGYFRLRPNKHNDSGSHSEHHDHQADEATVKAHYPFNAKSDAKILYKAMEGLGIVLLRSRKLIRIVHFISIC